MEQEFISLPPPGAGSPLATDQHFFTNAPGYTLLDRFRETLGQARCFDVLSGYFRLSGFHQLADCLETTDKVRILVGMEVDRPILAATSLAAGYLTAPLAPAGFDFYSHQQHRETYAEAVRQEAATSPDTPEVESSLRQLLVFLMRACPLGEALDRAAGNNGRHLEIRVVPQRNVHAKVYITHYRKPVALVTPATVITGSSNFTFPGLQGQREFNMELKSGYDVLFAQERFEELWREGVDVSEAAVAAIQRQTWLREDITPYELYLKLLYEYFQEQINQAEDDEDLYLPEGFRRLRYQTSAALDARRVLDTYNGVFLADVVGLGKTIVTALLLQQLPGRKLIVCPPVLIDYWEESMRDFGVQRFKVVSLGKLDRIIEEGPERYQYVIVDEAHRFRNEGTQAYEQLHRICWGRKVVLVSATPLNNTIADIRNLVKLFQAPRHSTIPGLPNLDGFFAPLEKRVEEARRNLRRAEKADDVVVIREARETLRQVVREVADQVRDRVLKFLMVRRTRTDIRKYFADDLKMQGLHFPAVSPPRRIIYEYTGAAEVAFLSTVQALLHFHYARYQPLLYLQRDLSTFEEAAQRNVGDFMRGLLVKRLESSLFAFRRSLERFVVSYQQFIKMLDTGTLYLGKSLNRYYDLLEKDDLDGIEKLLDAGKIQEFDSRDFTAELRDHLVQDLETLQNIQALWQGVEDDPKLDKFLACLRDDKTLAQEQMVIFTESRETGEYLFRALNAEYPGQVIFASSHGGETGDPVRSYSPADIRDQILRNYDPRYAKARQSSTIRFLVTTDVLAEGVNLHRACVLLNYDLPWNPTRVLQRAGRVNRIGSKHNHIYIYNFFPTTHSDAHLGLENNVVNKIQLFHDLLGEDAQYLSEGEQVSSRELFKKLNEAATYEGEQGEDSELPYLTLIRKVKDEQPELFEKLKELPRKARQAYRPELAGSPAGLITFFRTGLLRKFFTADAAEPAQELTFFDAVQRMKATPKTKGHPVPGTYYDLLNRNKDAFMVSLSGEVDSPSPATASTGNPHLRKLIPLVRSFTPHHKAQLTEHDEEVVKQALQKLQAGAIAKLASKKLLEKLQQPRVFNDPKLFLKALTELLGHIVTEAPEPARTNNAEGQLREVILSAYLLPTGSK